jgi:hypothetical protein
MIQIKHIIKSIFGLDDDSCESMCQLIDEMQLTEQVEQHITSLPECVSQFVSDYTDGDDSSDSEYTNFSKFYNKHNVDDWDPEEDRNNSEIERNVLPNVTSAKDYPIPKAYESVGSKKTFLQYIAEEYPQQSNQQNNQQNNRQPNEFKTPAQIDAQLDGIGNNGVSRAIDPALQRQINQLEASGNMMAAEQLRKRALRTAKIVKTPQTPAEALVASRKKQLSQAIQAAQAAQAQNANNQQPTNNPQIK